MSNSAAEAELNSYELLDVGIEATEGEIRTAYRQRSRKVHPDRNRSDPEAGRKFHELNQAYELLLDPLRRLALDAKIRVVQARKQRYEKYDNKRKHMLEELEQREADFKKARMDKAAADRTAAHEAEKIKDEGRRMREEREKELRRRDEEAEQAAAAAREENEPPPIGQLDTTVRFKYPLASHSDLTTPDALSSYLSSFGPTDTSSIVLSMKPPKKAPQKPPKYATALVPFARIGDAHAAVCASGRAERGLGDFEVSWAGGSEPEILGWLRKIGKFGGGETKADDEGKAKGDHGELKADAGILPQHSESKSSETLFSSFPSTFPDLSTPPPAPIATGLDYETLTLMRMRQAERERLERELREQEAAEP
ncbi:DnaJ-domain-containing protein [Auriscalpium vulgare]|uniref:DnaJ-domain-containing protein n=1 Tax=Auriscalpium vulgare TaxID=40419 RepID=A0ACB8S8B8_9AGAM|nr:DnaJ-domain-containing protein [Auriscalpium vulgare]